MKKEQFVRRKLTLRRSRQGERLSPMLRALKVLHSMSIPNEAASKGLVYKRRSQEILGRIASPTIGMDWSEFPIRRIPCGWMRSREPHDERRAILYCHGGGYTSGNLGYSQMLASRFVHETGIDTLCFEYRLAPEHPYPAALEDALTAWDYLMLLGYRADDLIVAGDSAGGNLALVLCHRLRAANRPLPGAVILMSPWTDLTLSGASLHEKAAIDPILTPEYIVQVRDEYTAGADVRSPFVSPLLGDFTDFPPTLIQVGDHEILFDDAKSLADKMERQGANVRFEVYEDMWHVFQMLPSKKSTAAMESVRSFLTDTE
jgi:acetyl esterase/lipase